tara:strand:+ start:136 stop:387 length:252 start_codon:yes stop_codon:yes gene_type:complete
MTITNMFSSFSLDKQKMIEYNYSLLDNMITLDIPVENTKNKIQVKIEIENINSFKIKKMFVSKQKKVTKEYSQLSELKSVMKG